MTAAEFRANPELVKQLRSVLEMDVVQLAFEVMSEEHPVKTIPSHGITPQYAGIQLGQNVGYETYAYRFKLLGKGIEIPQTTPEPTYEDPPEALTNG